MLLPWQPWRVSRRPPSRLMFMPSMRFRADGSFHGILWSLRVCKHLISSGRSLYLRKLLPDTQRSRRGWHEHHPLLPTANLSTHRSLTRCTKFQLLSLNPRPRCRHSNLNLHLNPHLSLNPNPNLNFNLKLPRLNESHNHRLCPTRQWNRHHGPPSRTPARRSATRMKLSLLRIRPVPCDPKPLPLR